MKKIRDKKGYILLVVILIFASTYYAGMSLRYKYWNLYVHKGLTFFLDSEFRELLSKYRNNNNFASIEGKDTKGIIVTYPLKARTKYSIQLRLEKNLRSNLFMFRAEISSPEGKSHYDTGSPPIYMEIPMQYFKKVINEGINDEQIRMLFASADKENWRPLGLNTEEKLSAPVILQYR